MSIRDLHTAFMKDANKLSEYASMSKTQLANGYCDADEASVIAKAQGNIAEATRQEKLRSSYFSALMIRYWYKVYEWQSNSASLMLDKEEFIEWLSHSLYVAFYYREWRYEYQAITRHGKFIDWKYDEQGNKILNKYYYIKDDTAVDKIINRCCASMRGRVYQSHNKDKRKANTQTYSLDSMVEDNGDSALEFTKCTQDDQPPILRGIHILVNEFIKKDQPVEALIIDGIANYDSYKVKKDREQMLVQNKDGEFVNKKVTKTSTVFDPRKLVRHLTSLDANFITDFCKGYQIDLSKQTSIYEKLKGLTNAKLYKYIKKTLTQISQDKALLDCLHD